MSDKDQISIIWGAEDVAGRAQELNIALTKEEVRTVLANIDRRHDASIGINWDVIDAHIETFDNDRSMVCEDCDEVFLKKEVRPLS